MHAPHRPVLVTLVVAALLSLAAPLQAGDKVAQAQLAAAFKLLLGDTKKEFKEQGKLVKDNLGLLTELVKNGELDPDGILPWTLDFLSFNQDWRALQLDQAMGSAESLGSTLIADGDEQTLQTVSLTPNSQVGKLRSKLGKHILGETRKLQKQTASVAKAVDKLADIKHTLEIRAPFVPKIAPGADAELGDTHGPPLTLDVILTSSLGHLGLSGFVDADRFDQVELTLKGAGQTWEETFFVQGLIDRFWIVLGDDVPLPEGNFEVSLRALDSLDPEGCSHITDAISLRTTF
jgi:hypothetical protein